MASFSDSNFVKKLAELNPSQQSIQTLSLWLIHHRKHAETYVNVWKSELFKASNTRKLTFIYLANDVLQNGRRKGQELLDTFATVLPEAFRHTAKETEEKTSQSLARIINIWEERKIFDQTILAKLHDAIADVKQPSKDSTPAPAEPAAKKKKAEDIKLALQEQISAVVEEPAVEIPDPEDLAKLITDIISSASSDAEVRQKIAALPPEVSDASHLKQLKGRIEADKLAKTVDDAHTLVTEYNGRLATELANRRNLSQVLAPFITSQKDKLAESQSRLKEFKQKLENAIAVRKELDHHIKNLPDLTKLPDANAGLAPLPSAGDLFSL